MNQIEKLARELGQSGLAVEVAALLGCLLLAWAFCWLIGRRRSADSVWFGRAIIDGLLFPLLALVFTYSARLLVADYQRLVLLKIGFRY